MRIASLCFLLGLCLVLFFSLPVFGGVIAVSVVAGVILCLYFRYVWTAVIIPIIFLMLGGGYAERVSDAYQHQQATLPFKSGAVVVKGVVDSIPSSSETVQTFLFRVDEVDHVILSQSEWMKASWYYYDKRVHAGEHWQFFMSMKPPHGLANPGVIDQERTYFVHVPASYSEKKPAPLVFVFHGGGGTAKNSDKFTHFSELSDKKGFIVVYPQGVDKSWNDGRNSQKIASQRDNVDDIGFVTALLDQWNVNIPSIPNA